MVITSGKPRDMKQKIITTRPMGKSASGLAEECFEIVNVPVTKLVPKKDMDTGKIEEFDPTVGVFTSSRGAEIFLSLFPGNRFSGMKMVAIGEKTAEILSGRYGQVVVPDEKTSHGVNALLDGIISGKDRIVLFSSAKSNRIVLEHLREKNWQHMMVELYDAEEMRIEPLLKVFSGGDCFGMIVTSSMEADLIFNKQNGKCLTAGELSGKHIFAIGRTTAETLEKLGIPVSNPVGKSNLKGLLRDIELEYCPQK